MYKIPRRTWATWTMTKKMAMKVTSMRVEKFIVLTVSWVKRLNCRILLSWSNVLSYANSIVKSCLYCECARFQSLATIYSGVGPTCERVDMWILSECGGSKTGRKWGYIIRWKRTPAISSKHCLNTIPGRYVILKKRLNIGLMTSTFNQYLLSGQHLYKILACSYILYSPSRALRASSRYFSDYDLIITWYLRHRRELLHNLRFCI